MTQYSPHLVACVPVTRGYWRANSETGLSEKAAFFKWLQKSINYSFFLKPKEGVMSSFVGTSSIYLLPEDNYLSSCIAAYRLDSSNNHGLFLVELPKIPHPSLHTTLSVGNRNK